MFAVVNHLYLTKPVDEFREPLERDGLPLLASQPGFIAFHLVRAADDHAIVVILWESPAAAQNGAAVFGPTWFHNNIIPYLKSEQQRSVGPVLVSSR